MMVSDQFHALGALTKGTRPR